MLALHVEQVDGDLIRAALLRDRAIHQEVGGQLGADRGHAGRLLVVAILEQLLVDELFVGVRGALIGAGAGLRAIAQAGRQLLGDLGVDRCRRARLVDDFEAEHRDRRLCQRRRRAERHEQQRYTTKPNRTGHGAPY